MLLLAILLPPLYFLLNQKLGMCVLTSAMFILAFFLACTIVMIPGALILWVIAMIAALRHHRRKEMNQNMVKHADLIATKMSEKLQPTQTPPPISSPTRK